MVFHAAELIAVWIQAAQQNPVVVQLQQNAGPMQVQVLPEKGLGLASWIAPVISGLLSFFVAWMVFHMQGNKERKQWLRDQKKAEWKLLLKSVSQVGHVLHMGSGKTEERLRLVLQDLKPAVQELRQAQMCCVFIKDYFAKVENQNTFDSFLDTADKTSDEIYRLFDIERCSISSLPGGCSYAPPIQINHINGTMESRTIPKFSIDDGYLIIENLSNKQRKFIRLIRDVAYDNLGG